MKFTNKLIATVAAGVFTTGAVLAQNPTRLQLLDASGNRGVLAVPSLTGTRTYNFPDVSGALILSPLPSTPTLGKITRWGANNTLLEDATGILEGDIADGAITSDKILNGAIKLEDLDPLSIGTLSPGTAENNTLRWSPAGSGSWVQTNKLTVGADGDVIINATQLVGLDLRGGYMRIREVVSDQDDTDVLLRAEGDGDAVAELRLGMEDDFGNFMLYSKNNAGVVHTIRTDQDILQAGTSVSYLQVDGTLDITTLRGAVAIQLESPQVVVTSLSTAGVVKTTVDGELSSGLLATAEIEDDAITLDKMADASVGTDELVVTGVTAATYGAATKIPQIEIGADGRITSATDIDIEALPTPTLNGVTLRWDGSDWVSTTNINVSAVGEVVLDAVQTGGGGDNRVGGYAYFGDAFVGSLGSTSDVEIIAWGDDEGKASLTLGGVGQNGAFNLYSVDQAGDPSAGGTGIVLEVKADNGVLEMGNDQHYFRINDNPSEDYALVYSNNAIVLDGPVTATTTMQVDGDFTAKGAVFNNIVQANVAAYDVAADDHIVIAEGATDDVNLPAGANGRVLIIKNETGGDININPAGANTVNGVGAYLLADGNAVKIVFNGGNWFVIP